MADRQHDIFICHCQASGQDQATILSRMLESNGAGVSYNTQAHDATAMSTESAIRQSRCVLVVLSDGLMSSTFCTQELRWAKAHGCSFLGVIERDVRHSAANFAVESQRAPADLKHLFEEVEFLDYQRGHPSTVEAMVSQICSHGGCDGIPTKGDRTTFAEDCAAADSS